MSDVDFPKLDLLYGPHLRWRLLSRILAEVSDLLNFISNILVRFLHEEVGETPDENDLFPSTPLDEDQLKHYNAQEELGAVVINQVGKYFSVRKNICFNKKIYCLCQISEEVPELAWSDIPWSDPRWLDLRPLMYNAAENAEVFAMNMWKKFQSWKVVGFSNLPQFLQVNV